MNLFISYTNTRVSFMGFVTDVLYPQADISQQIEEDGLSWEHMLDRCLTCGQTGGAAGSTWSASSPDVRGDAEVPGGCARFNCLVGPQVPELVNPYTQSCYVNCRKVTKLFLSHVIQAYVQSFASLQIGNVGNKITNHWVLYDCSRKLFTFENGVPPMRQGASVVWHHSLLLINSFNKIQAAVFTCRLCLRAFPFVSLIQSTRQPTTGHLMSG